MSKGCGARCRRRYIVWAVSGTGTCGWSACASAGAQELQTDYMGWAQAPAVLSPFRSVGSTAMSRGTCRRLGSQHMLEFCGALQLRVELLGSGQEPAGVPSAGHERLDLQCCGAGTAVGQCSVSALKLMFWGSMLHGPLNGACRGGSAVLQRVSPHSGQRGWKACSAACRCAPLCTGHPPPRQLLACLPTLMWLVDSCVPLW